MARLSNEDFHILPQSYPFQRLWPDCQTKTSIFCRHRTPFSACGQTVKRRLPYFAVIVPLSALVARLSNEDFNILPLSYPFQSMRPDCHTDTSVFCRYRTPFRACGQTVKRRLPYFAANVPLSELATRLPYGYFRILPLSNPFQSLRSDFPIVTRFHMLNG